MKWQTYLLSGMLCCASAEDVVLHREYSAKDGETVDYRVDAAELRKVPAWEPKAGAKPPLRRDRAVEIARQAAASSGEGELKVTLCTVNRFEKDLLKRLPKDGCRWFYVVEFRKDGREPFRCVVTMSGTVAKTEAAEE
ncbi:hypothetical protein OKA05_18645 [Luteolibacter arcticus]|uniref:Uncharacterized protein n=1 Tax=Luteolibacter arcticus TaxID=1581411 RepID=A0ABT3GM96_9BACT|nr:hypothetical protein [Luteolibacter arcticus]MCW1924590.1 hypothetical protein [Luteolibacter arcticus]